MFKSTDVIGIFGRRGSGKSFLGKKIQTAFPRRIIFDTTFEYDGQIITSYDEFAEFMLAHENSKEFEVIVRFDIDTSKKSEQFDEMVKLIYARGSVLVVIEEIQNFCTPYQMSPYLEHLFTTGRHRDLAVIFTTQRPAQVHKTAMSQCTHIFCGQLHDKNDLNQVSNFLGRESKELSNLKEHHFIWWRPGKIVQLDDNFRVVKSNTEN